MHVADQQTGSEELSHSYEESHGQPRRDAGNLDSDERWLSIQRIVSSTSFTKATRLCAFLQYIAERSIEGRIDEITEQQIGVHVFGRATDYNPGDDNIVRQTARQLRQRLALYYQEEGGQDAIQVSIPRGAYVPHFLSMRPSFTGPASRGVESEVAAKVLVSSTKQSVPSTPARKRHANLLLALLSSSVGLVIGIALTVLWTKGMKRHTPSDSAREKLWATLFSPEKTTLLIPGDAGINMYSNFAGTQVGVSEYASGAYLSKPGAQQPAGVTWDSLASRRYTTLSDLKFATSLMQLPQVAESHLEIRFARDVQFQDLQTSNAILMGSPNYDPWVQLFQQGMNFRMVYDGSANRIRVLNARPQSGEQPVYEWNATDPQRKGYALIVLTNNLQASGKILLVEGTAMGGVDAASDFLLHSDQLAPFLDKASRKGSLANFELLLETTMYFGGSTQARVVASRTS